MHLNHTHTAGGVPAHARESLAAHRERAAGKGGLYTTTAEESARARDRGKDGGDGEALRASDAKLRSELDRFRSRGGSAREGGGSDVRRSREDGDHDGRRERGRGRDARGSTDDRGGRSGGSSERDREGDRSERSKGGHRSDSSARPSSSGRSSADYHRSESGRSSSRGRSERDREREWERDGDARPSTSGRSGRGEWDPTPVRQ